VILIAGGVKSGRTTTLYSLRQELAAGRAVADVARDEYFPCVEGVDARNVSSLDADVVVVNDLDTPAVAQLAFQAAQGGRLVLASIFADDVGVAIARLVDDLGVSHHVLGACLRAVSAQRLCRRLCSACPAGAPSADCARCKGTGYKGRLALYEVAEVTGELLVAVRAGETSPEALRRAAVAGGMTTLADDGARKVALGRTDAREARG
jgi:type II secretory ATPase GspE/PulE/Tfp pilus assembly ATPase PilB-like protein